MYLGGGDLKKCAVEVAERNNRGHDFFVVWRVDGSQNLHRAVQILQKATGGNRRQQEESLSEWLCHNY